MISTTSPIGKALLGRRVGDEVKVQTPAGVKEFEVIRLKTIHEDELNGVARIALKVLPARQLLPGNLPHPRPTYIAKNCSPARVVLASRLSAAAQHGALGTLSRAFLAAEGYPGPNRGKP